MTPYCVVLITAPDAEAADKLSSRLVESKLAACVNQLNGLKSRYWWEGKVETAKESLLIVKTRGALVSELIQLVKTVHPYSVPEIIALPIADGHASYLDWLGANTRFATKSTR